MSGTLTRVSGEDIDTYAILQGSLNNDNYALTFIPGTFRIIREPNIDLPNTVRKTPETNIAAVAITAATKGGLVAEMEGGDVIFDGIDLPIQPLIYQAVQSDIIIDPALAELFKYKPYQSIIGYN